MLNSIRLTNFKNHADTTVRLGELTLLVGPNGAGKTGVLQGIHLVSQVLQGEVAPTLAKLGGREVLIRRGADRFAIELAGKDPRDSHRTWEIWLTMGRRSKARKDTVNFSVPGKPPIKSEGVLDSPLISGKFADAREALGTAVYLRLDATRLLEPSYLGAADTRVDFDGYGLASTIAHLMTYERDRFERLESALQSIIPGVERIRVRRVKTRTSIRQPDSSLENKEVLADEIVLDMRSGDALPVRAISEGTLIVLGLLAVLEGSDRPNLILIDDIDQSLHPRAQAQLVELLRSLVRLQPKGLQIVATSHSPYLIDALSQDEVWVVALREDGTAAAGRLADHPDSEHFRDVLGTGEFLISVGEDWVLQQGAVNASGPDR